MSKSFVLLSLLAALSFGGEASAQAPPPAAPSTTPPPPYGYYAGAGDQNGGPGNDAVVASHELDQQPLRTGEHEVQREQHAGPDVSLAPGIQQRHRVDHVQLRALDADRVAALPSDHAERSGN